VHQVQQVTSLALTNWQLVTSMTITNDPQVVLLPLPAASTAFWRVIAQ